MVILQITTLDEFHECVVQAMFHFPALAALSIILASVLSNHTVRECKGMMSVRFVMKNPKPYIGYKVKPRAVSCIIEMRCNVPHQISMQGLIVACLRLAILKLESLK